MNARRLFIAGNWKMNTVRESAQHLARQVVSLVGQTHELDIAICPPFPYLALVHDVVAGSRIRLGAQNMYFESSGAFTGEVSAAMLADCGCKHVILGHSERRHVLGETDDGINRKVHVALSNSLHPILCVGETLAQRESELTKEVIANQLRYDLVGVRPEQLRDIVIAYEPVWAIGTGKTATPQMAEDAHLFIRETLTEMYGADLSQTVAIQYGGSVKPDNAAGLLEMPNVDGLLIGGASLKAEDFAHIVRAGVDLSARH